MAGLKQAIVGRQRIVENGIVGEVPHGKGLDPPHWTRMPLARRIHPLNRDSPGEHLGPRSVRLGSLHVFPLLGLNAESLVVVVALDEMLPEIFQQQYTRLHRSLAACRQPELPIF